METTKNKYKYFSKGLFLIILFLFISFSSKSIKADEFDDKLDDYCEDNSLSKNECDEFKESVDADETEYDNYENQLKNAERLLKLTIQKRKTYEGQIQTLNSEIKNVQGDISSLEGQISTTQGKIETLKERIESKEQNIKDSQTSLGEMLRNYYRLSQDLGLSFLSKESGLTKIFNQSDSLGQLSTKINNVLQVIREEKAILSQEREDHEIEKGKLHNQKSELDQEKKTLSIKKSEKGTLLTRTQGEEAQYQSLISNIESQMKQLLVDVDSLSAAEQGELNDILDDATKPKEGLASTSWYYSQRDSEWKNDKIAGTSLTMGSYGCAITAVAMVFDYYGENVEPDDIGKRTSFFNNGGEIIWGGKLLTEYDMTLDSYDDKKDDDKKDAYGTWHGNYDEDEMKDLIEDHERPVIVFIKGSGRSGHYVVVHGYDDKNDDFVVHDPYWGANLLLGTSKSLIKSIYGKATIDQMIVYKPD